MAETGLSLVVSKEMLDRLQKADHQITNLATKSEQASKRIISAFTEMGQKGVGAFINKLNEAQQKISSLSSLKINFANIIPNSAQSVDSINKIVQALQQLSDSQLGKLSSMQNKLDYRKQLNDLKQLKVLEDERGREITRQNRRNIESNKVYSEQLKTATMQAIVKERERQIELKRSIAEINRLAKAYKAMPTILTSKGAGTLIAGSVQATSINQRLTAIQNLKNATKDLDTSDKRYQKTLSKLNSEIDRHKQELQNLGVNLDKVNTKHRGLLNISEQLQRRLALLFSVSQITGYINKLISVRGEFELQQRALQAILQNREEADRLWEKTVQLAVQSPFQVKELVTYTKQLAAYRVESDKLYDTTKMLADVSAGLGVDMQRLILAFGQVKAANYLRGTELRQFSEAGINILGELATYFTELEGITVSVGEVFERVSKRMVTFGDVEEIFKRLTSAGGTFYRMQEIQAETLRGQISNLKDSIDIMLNKVGKANENTLKNTVSLVRRFVESWKNIVDILHAAGAAFVIVTTAKLKDALATGVWAKANIAATATQKGLNAVIARGILALRGLWATLMANPITALLAGLAALGVGLYRLVKRSIDANKAFKDNIEQLTAQNSEIKKYTDELNILVKRQNELVESNKELAVTSEEYRENSLEISRIENKRKSIIESINSLDSTYAKNLKNAGLNIAELTKQTSEYNQELITRLALERDLKNLSGEEFLEDFNNATTELNISASKVEASYKKTITSVNKLLQQPDKLSDNARKALENFNNSTEPFLDRFIKLHQETAFTANELWEKLDFSPIGNYITKLFEFNKLFDKVEPELRKSANTFKDSQLGVNLFSIISDANASEEDKSNAKNKIIDYFEDILDDKGIVGKLREKATNLFADIFNFKWSKENIPNPLEEWKVVYNEFIASLDQEGGVRIAPATLETTLEQLRKDVKSEVDRLTKEIVEYENASEELKKARKSQYESDKISLENYKKIREFLGYTPEKATKDGKDNTWTNLMRVVKEVNTEFKNLNNTFDKTTALQGTLAKYSDALTTAFKGTGKAFTDFDFTTESGLLEFYDWLIKVIPEVDKLKAQLAKGEVVWDVRINEKELEDKSILDQIEEMFSGYEISLELQKLNIPKDWAKDFFGIETFDLSDIRTRIESELQKKIGEDRRKELEKDLEKVKEMEVKAQQERLKTYLQYARDAVGDRAKIKLEEMRKLQEIEKTFTTPEQEEVKQKAIAKVKEDSQKDLNKLEWEEFQKSDTFINLFSDLDNASSALINHSLERLREFKEQWKNMPLEDMRAIVGKINELEIALATINPFEGIKDLKKNIKDAIDNTNFSIDAQKFIDKGDYVSAFEIERAYQEERLKASQQEISDIETVLRLKEEGKTIDDISLNLTKNQQLLFALGVNSLRTQLKIQKDISKNAQGGVDNSNDALIANTKLQKKYAAQADAIGTAQDMANDLYDAFKDLSDALGGGDGIGAIFADMGMQMMNTVFNTLQLQLQLKAAGVQAEIFGIQMNAAMGIIGWIVMAVQLVAQVLGAIFAAHDKRLENQIENLKKQVDELNEKLEQLEEQLEKAFNISSLQSYTKQVEKNIDAQIVAYQKMIALEKDKKKTDNDKITEYQDSIKELQERQKEIQQEVVSTATNGILDSVKDAARDFVDAWYEAFAETGDGLQGLKDNFQEIMLDMVQQQASMTIAGNFLERWKRQLNKYINPDDLKLTADEAGNWVRSVQEELPMLNEALQQYFKAMEQAGVNLGQTTDDLSGLQAGIQNITEEQAAAIEAYLNSIRFFVAQNNTMLATLVSSFTNSETSNPILSELRTQSEMIRAIRDMFNSVIGRGNSAHSGAYLKVAM